MSRLYIVLAGVHILSLVATGVLWTVIDLKRDTALRRHLRDIRAVYFGSLWLFPSFLGLSWAFERREVPAWRQMFFPIGLGSLIVSSGVGWLFPLPEGIDPFYYWTVGKAKVFALIGLACLVVCLLWTAGVLTVFAIG